MTTQPGPPPLADLVARIKKAQPPPPMTTRVVAVDGRGGAGKSTLAGQLAAALGDAPVIRTDDFASRDNPIEWWPRLLAQVLRPLAANAVARYRRYDWSERRLAEWMTLPQSPDVVVLEGVTACRVEFDSFLTFRIWVETPRDLCLSRGLRRDGNVALPQWEAWMAAEDDYISRQDPMSRVDVVVSGSH